MFTLIRGVDMHVIDEKQLRKDSFQTSISQVIVEMVAVFFQIV